MSSSACGFKSEGLADDSPCGLGGCPPADAAFDAVADGVDVDDGVAPTAALMNGEFVGAAVSGNAGGIDFRGMMHWSAAVSGTSAGITLQGSLE